MRAQARWLALIAKFDRRKAWAYWLNWKCGLNPGAAREKLRVAHALERLPRIAQSMAAGRLRYAKVRAMTRVADEANKESQELTREARQQAGRELTWFHDDDDSLVLRADAGAVFLKALVVAEDGFPPQKTLPWKRF